VIVSVTEEVRDDVSYVYLDLMAVDDAGQDEIRLIYRVLRGYGVDPGEPDNFISPKGHEVLRLRVCVRGRVTRA